MMQKNIRQLSCTRGISEFVFTVPLPGPVDYDVILIWPPERTGPDFEPQVFVRST